MKRFKSCCMALVLVALWGIGGWNVGRAAVHEAALSPFYMYTTKVSASLTIAENGTATCKGSTVEEHDLISGDEVKFKGRDESNDVMTNTITFTSNSGLSRTTSYSTYCGAGTRIRLHGVCSKYSNSQGTDRIFTTEGRWTP